MKKVAFLLFIVLLAGGVVALYKYINFTKNYSSSNAVFVKSDSLTFLSFKLNGKVKNIYVKEGDNVKKGELLIELDTTELNITKNEIIKNIDALKNKINASIIQRDKLLNDIKINLSLLENEKNALDKNIKANKFMIESMEYQLSKLQNDYNKFKKLFLHKKISKEEYDKVKVAYFSLKSQIKAKKSELESLELNRNSLELKTKLIKNSFKEVKRLEELIKAQKNSLKSLNERLSLINQKIKDSFLYAPFTGKIAKKFVNKDEVIGAGRRVLSIVNLKDLYVLDLLEETKLKGIKKGCEAIIHIDALNKDFKGYVEKILPVSASTFALIPRDISSGEFTKLAQRFYVRIRFKEIPHNVLVGMSGEVIIKKCANE